jgi:hypothetical protein
MQRYKNQSFDLRIVLPELVELLTGNRGKTGNGIKPAGGTNLLYS